MALGDSADGAFDWAGLSHAYGPALDTPGHLRGLVDPDPEVRMRAVDHLWGSVLHQGTIYPATAPVVEAVSRLLADDSTAGLRVRLPLMPQEEPVSVCAQLLLFLAVVAASARLGGSDEQLAAWQRLTSRKHSRTLHDILGEAGSEWEKS